MTTEKEDLQVQVLKSLQDAKEYLRRSNSNDYVLYKRKDKLVLLTNKIVNGILDEKTKQYFSKNELKIISVYIYIHNESINNENKMTQMIYDYLYENTIGIKFTCLCEPDECCRKCCSHPDTTCIWKNYVEVDEWNDPDILFGGGTSYKVL
jgi:hypothetical protein